MMWEKSGGITDLHSHLIPGVDDGARTIEDSMEGIGRLWEAGVRSVVTTPHFLASLTRDLPAKAARMAEMDRGWQALVGQAISEYPELELKRGFEVMLDIPDSDLSDPNLHLGGTSFILVEWPHLRIPPGTRQVLQRITDAGARPVIAHPERYSGFDRSMALAGEWRDLGAYLQINYGSLLGRYGDAPRTRAFSLLERGWGDLFSTDFHGRPQLALNLLEVQEMFFGFEAGEQFDLLARVNPARIVSDQAPVTIPPLPRKKGWRDRLRDLLSGSWK